MRFFVNFVLSFPPRSLDAALEAGAPIVTFSWGQPDDLVERTQQHGAQVGIQVGTVDGAKRALESRPDFIICQGVEAGGHVQSTIPTFELLNQVSEIADSVPVVITGGRAGGRDLHRAFGGGAKAIMLGTRFVASAESQAHHDYKMAIVDSEENDSTYTICFDGGWPYAAHRVLRNSTLNDWESAGCPPSGQRPNEGEILVSRNDGSTVNRYDDDPPLSNMVGNALDGCLYAGTGCGRIYDMPNAKDVVDRIWAEYNAISR